MAKAIAAPAAEEDGPPAKSGPSLVMQIVVLLVMTLVAAGLGFASGNVLKPPAEPAKEEAAADHAKADALGAEKKDEKKDEEIEEPASLLPHAVNLPSVTTNLASPSDVWVRMELAVVFADAADPAIAETIHQDTLAFMRTVKLHQIDSASGFRHLKSDLEERARIRSDGKVTGVLIRTLLFE